MIRFARVANVVGGTFITLSGTAPMMAAARPFAPSAAGGFGMVFAAVAALLVVGVAVAIAYMLIVPMLRREIEERDRKIGQAQRTLQRLEQQVVTLSSAAAAAPAPARTASIAADRSGRRASGEDSRHELAARESRTPRSAQAAEPRSTDRTVKVRERLARYRDLIATRAKPRQMQDLIDEAGGAEAPLYDPEGQRLTLTSFDPNDPGQLLVALPGPEDRTLMVIPTYNYLENFRLAFSAPVQNPEVVRHLFELDKDDSGVIRLIDPALLRVDEDGSVHRVRMGRMGGYASSI